tara:strand:- start:509 stop:1318 length:810 start_codon:yes stop_codon:yes gene_type:complete
MELITSEALQTLESYKSYIMNYNLPLLGFNSSQKILKGFKEKKYTTGILYLQPADSVSRKTLCPFATVADCKDDCLGKKSGRLAMNKSQLAMTRRTIQYLTDPDGFKERLRAEILKNKKDNYCIRLNGTSDIDWSDLISSLPDVQFYDYSKVLKRVERNKLNNYHLTYSASFVSNKMVNETKKAFNLGLNIALPLNTKEAKGEFKRPTSITINGERRKLNNFDTTDLRFLDENGSIGTLLRKGSSIKQRLSEMTRPSFFGNINTLGLLA